MNARFYDPATGRFISRDSYTGNPYDPWTQHLYVYCGNNPTNMVDPTGFRSEHVTLAIDYNRQANELIAEANRFKDLAERNNFLADWYRDLYMSQNSKGFLIEAHKYRQRASMYMDMYNKRMDKAIQLGKDANVHERIIVKEVIEARDNSIEMDFGVGIGFGGTFSYLDMVDLNVLFAANAFHLQYRDQKTRLGIQGYTKAGVDLVGGAVQLTLMDKTGNFFLPYQSQPFFGEPEYEIDEPRCFVPGFSVGGYLGVGFSASVGFNVTKFVDALEQIF